MISTRRQRAKGTLPCKLRLTAHSEGWEEAWRIRLDDSTKDTASASSPAILRQGNEMEDKSSWYIAMLLLSIAVSATSIYASTLVDDSSMTFCIHTIAAVITYFISLISLSFSAAEHWRTKERFRIYRGKLRPFQLFPQHISIFVTQASGLIAGVYVFMLPIFCPSENIVLNAFLRASTFFYACMVLDLTVTRASQPPILRHSQEQMLYGLTNWEAHVEYVWKIFTETRYKSFNIAVDETRRHSIPAPVTWTYGPLLLFPLTYLFPVAELQVLSGLLLLNLILEGQHTFFHPRCPNWLFWQPFAAVTITEFWAVRWHKGANSFLHSLAYVPAKNIFSKYFGNDVGRAAGVLSAFSLSGIWHAWSGMPLMRDEYIWRGFTALWALFLLQGIAILVESLLLRDAKWKQGHHQQILRAVVWLYSVVTGSIWLRYSLPRAKPL